VPKEELKEKLAKTYKVFALRRLVYHTAC
jgi:hypothetical protein